MPDQTLQARITASDLLDLRSDGIAEADVTLLRDAFSESQLRLLGAGGTVEVPLAVKVVD